MNPKWEKRFERMRQLGLVALGGLVLAVVAIFASDLIQTFLAIGAGALILPAFIYVYVIVLLHWKARYRGKHSDLWGVLILIETSGWMKIVYLVRHLIPDMRQTGRYRLSLQPPVESPKAEL